MASSVRDEINKTLTSGQAPTALYAVAGAGDLAVEKLRGAQARFAQVSDQARDLPARVQGIRSGVETRVRDLPATLTGAYDELAERGKRLAGRVGSQQSTRDLTEGADEVVRSVKAATTTVEHGASSARKATKRTTTTAKKTASTARKAVADAADKTGDAGSAPKSTTSGAPHKRS